MCGSAYEPRDSQPLKWWQKLFGTVLFLLVVAALVYGNW